MFIEIFYIIIFRSESSWLPVCGSNWSDEWSDNVCKDLGFAKSHHTDLHDTKSDNVTDYFILKTDSSPEKFYKITSSVMKANESNCDNFIGVSCEDFSEFLCY